jgi:Holliday junction resolvase
MTPEGKVKAEIKKVLAEYGCWYFMPAMNGYGRSGIPDFIGCYKGVFFAVEAKSANGKLTPNQEREIAAMLAAGGRAVVARSAEAVRELMALIERGK